MTITNIIIIITLLLIASIIGSIIFTKKEQAAALKRQQVANYKFKADEAQDLYDGLQIAGLDKITYQFLLERIVFNLQEAYNLSPTAPGIKSRLGAAKRALADSDSNSYYVQMPSGMAELHGLVGRLNKLVRYLIILFQKRIISEQQYQKIMPSLQKTLLKFDAEGHIKMGHQAANEGQSGTAKQCYLHAKEKLLSFGTEDPYVIKQLDKVDGLLENLRQYSNKQQKESLLSTKAEEHLEEPKQDEKTQEEIIAKATQEELNKMSESNTDFTSKKKW